jgi:putative aminopeptidase FrvX
METIEYVIEKIKDLVEIPSPSGFTKEAMEYVKKEAESFGFPCESNRKGGLTITVKGQNVPKEQENEVLGISAHVDTLGAMVRSITSEGMLKFSLVGGLALQSIEGSYCKIHTREGRTYTGTILAKSPSVHTYDDARTLERNEKNMEVRIDEIVKNKEDVLALGINTGDYISFDANYSYTEKGFVKSRHLDDKAAVALILGMMKDTVEGKLIPKKNIKFVISNYEEVGFGASWIPQDITEFIAIDMGATGDDLNGTEYVVSICAKDAAGPYDYELTSQLIAIAKENNLDYVVDLFPHYSSDVSAALRGGNNIRGALIGQGIHASHGMERTHKSALLNTLKLIELYSSLCESR